VPKNLFACHRFDSPALKEDHKLRVFENKLMRRNSRPDGGNNGRVEKITQ
jgi:hypothetical protein